MPKSQGLINKEMLIDEINNLHNYFSSKNFTNVESIIICHQFISILTVTIAGRHK